MNTIVTPDEIRNKYLDFYKKRGHVIIPSARLVPENDPTTLFTGSGMQPLLPYLLGEDHPEGGRVANSQKCFRSGDIEEVGDNRHTTFFEMLGNWSLGDYFKKEQINFFWDFLTKEIGLDPSRIYITCYIGHPETGIDKDIESAAIWKSLFTKIGINANEVDIGTEENGYRVGEQGGRIFFYGDKNWWSRVGGPDKMPTGEPGGPDTEVFYQYPEIAHDEKWGKHCHPNCDCGRYIELGNSVFMQYLKTKDGFSALPKQNVDYGGGLERITAAVNNSADVFPTNHAPILMFLEELSGKKYGTNEKETRAFRIIADHMKAAVFLIADSIKPSNADQGYFVRRLIRRAVRQADSLGIADLRFSDIVRPIAGMYKDTYPEVYEQVKEIEYEISQEEDRFRTTLTRGVRELERFIGQGSLSAKDTFSLVTTYGFPLELIIEEAGERGVKQIDTSGFSELLKEHQNLSRTGSAQKFKGGLADTSEATTRLHTVHHLLLKALQLVLGPQVKQRGSNITADRLRIDFSYGEKMTENEKKSVETIVNEKIQEHLPMIRSLLPKQEAEKLGAEQEFGAKYPDTVCVYSLGPNGATEKTPRFTEAFSIEFCGGPHVNNTEELQKAGVFRIIKEESVAAGIRRIKATLS